MDVLAIAMADLSSISERRLARLIDPTMSYGLPRNLLAGKRGLNTGFATVQCSMSALVMENRGLSMPGSVDSIPGKSNAEDHVSNSTWCGRKARTIVENAEQIVAGELLMAAQALSLVDPIAREYPLGKGTRAAIGGDQGGHSPRPRRRSVVCDRDGAGARSCAVGSRGDGRRGRRRAARIDKRTVRTGPLALFVGSPAAYAPVHGPSGSAGADRHVDANHD